MQIVPAPDFPTGAMILGQVGARNAYTTGRGSIMMRATHAIEDGRGDRRSIVLTSIPFQVGKSGLVEKIAEAARDKRIEGMAKRLFDLMTAALGLALLSPLLLGIAMWIRFDSPGRSEGHTSELQSLMRTSDAV